MAIQIQIRRDTASNWSSNNPTLAIGELGFVTDTSQLKIGSGSVAWNSLPYFLNSASATTVEIAAAVANLIDLSPSTLNTLNELAAAIGDDANFFTTVNSNIVSASAYALSQANAYADGLTTADVAENTNLYFTNQRAVNAGSATYLTQAAYASASPNFATDAELANKLDTSTYASASANFATDAELSSAIVTASAAAVAYADALTTADVSENTNLYFTNERAVNAGSATYILQTSQQGIINSASAAAVTAVLDGAPGALDTLNELAAALNDDASFATTVTNSISTKLDLSTASATYLTQAAYASASPNFATDAELANKLDTSTYASASANFATDAELASAIVTASAAAVAYADGLTTTDIAEGTSLYYTNTRGLETASTAFVHANHTGMSAVFTSNQVRFDITAIDGGGV